MITDERKPPRVFKSSPGDGSCNFCHSKEETVSITRDATSGGLLARLCADCIEDLYRQWGEIL